MYLDLSTRHDWLVKNAVVDLPIRLTGNSKRSFGNSFSPFGAQKKVACSAGVFFERAICLRKCHIETSRIEEEMGRVKGSREGAGREKRKRLPENTVKMRNAP